jgi:hypothetical protein
MIIISSSFPGQAFQKLTLLSPGTIAENPDIIAYSFGGGYVHNFGRYPVRANVRLVKCLLIDIVNEQWSLGSFEPMGDTVGLFRAARPCSYLFFPPLCGFIIALF